MGLMLGQVLQQTMKQELRMTPQLQQAIRMLQLSRMDLIEEVQKELLDNPLLEEKEDSTDSATDQNHEHSSDTSTVNDDVGEQGEFNEIKDIQFDTAQGDQTARSEMEWDRYDEDRPEYHKQALSDFSEHISLEATYSRSDSLQDHLLWQVQMSDLNDREQEIIKELIGNLNEKGYLQDISLEEIQDLLNQREQDLQESKFEKEEIEDILDFMQNSLDPIGVGSRSLQECLLIQCKTYQLGKDLETLLMHHMEDLERRKWDVIAKKMKLSLQSVAQLVDMLKQLDPSPGYQFLTTPPTYITPDLYVDEVEGQYVVRVNDQGLPSLKINQYYRTLIKQTQKNDLSTHTYLSKRLESAQALMHNILYRKQSIVRVMECLLEKQEDFFQKGPEFLKPLVLQDVADEIGVHASTVSRVTSNKYVSTPQGVFELKYFFNSTIQGNSASGDLASEAVKIKIKRLIAQEPSRKPLSDQKIAQLLEQDGLKIARRTVAKYRESMRIPPSSQRKSLL